MERDSDLPGSAVTPVRDAEVPLDRDAVRAVLERLDLDLGRASIRETNSLVNAIESELGIEFIRMEFGIPGLPTPEIALDAENRALREARLSSVYAPFDGLPALKQEASRFVKLFLDLDVPARCCVPTIGAMEGCFAGMALASRMHADRNTVLCLEPGFPANKLQARFLGLRRETIDFYDHRGETLIDAVERRVAQGDVCAILWSSPNNPTWIVLRESELQGIGRICDEHDVLAIEDLAYFGMDVRQDYTQPGVPPFQPTVLRYTRRGLCLISSSKMFSYAGQRIALAILSPGLMDLEMPDLVERLGTRRVGHAFLHGVLYPLTACVPQSPQHGLQALLAAANRGDRAVFRPAREYARRAAVMKRLFLDNGFRLVYDNDLGEPLADGFYFTIAYPRFDSGSDLLRELLHYGVSAITLESAGSCRTEGLRACVSMVADAQWPVLERRLQRFHADHA